MESEIVLNQDDRIRVNHTSLSPFRWTCSLEVEFSEPVLYPLGPLERPNQQWRTLEPTLSGCGSGLLVSPHHVLTSAHVIAGLKTVKGVGRAPLFQLVPAKKVTIIPGRNEAVRIPQPFDHFISHKLKVFPGFKKWMENPSGVSLNTIKQALAHDIGLIEINSWPGEKLGWWGLDDRYDLSPVSESFRTRLDKKEVAIAGYPGEKGKIACGTPYRSAGQVVATSFRVGGKTQDVLLYDADTSAGMSGSPVWVKSSGGRYRLVAVHSSFLDYKLGQRANAGALITPDIFRWLRLQGVFPVYQIGISTQKMPKTHYAL